MTALALGLALLVGLPLGLLGGGGSILAVPVLVYGLGYPAKPAIAMSLAVVGVSSLIAAAFHWRLGNVRLRAAGTFGVFAMGGAFVGARLAAFVPEPMQLTAFALVTLAAGVMMVRRRDEDVDVRDGEGVVRADSPRVPLLAPAAFAIGVLTGLVGVGGGFLVVPALVVLGRLPMRHAVGTSLAVIALNSAAGFVGYTALVRLDWAFLASFTTATVVGALAGAAMASHVRTTTLRRAFAVLLVAGGGMVLYKNRDAFGTTDVAATPRMDRPAVSRH